MKISSIKYERINKEEVFKQFNDYIEQFKNASSANEQIEILKKVDELSIESQTMLTLAFIRNSLDTNDEFYAKEKDYIDEISPEFALAGFELNKAMINSKFIDELRAYYPKIIFTNIELSIKGMDEKLVPLMQEENAIVTEYSNLINNIMVEYNGEKYTLAGMGKFAVNEDREVRKSSSIASGHALSEAKEKFDDIYDRLVKVRTKMAKALNMENYVELGYIRMMRNSYDRKDIDKFRANVKKYIVPAVSDIKEKISNKFNWDKLYFYDNGVYTEKEPRPIGTPKEIFEKGSVMYKQLNEETSKLFDRMVEDEAFDVMPRKGKFGGGYCTSIDKYLTPFILANFNGSAGDVEVLTHEFGHAFAAEKAFELPLQLRNPTMETCEVHSMSMEFLTYPWMKEFFGENTEDFKFKHIADSLAFIPYGTIVDAFQTWVYDNPEATPADRNAKWKSLENEFLPHVSFEGHSFFEEGRRWQRQMHIFEMPFYYIDYCLAQFVAFQFLALSLKDFEGAFKKYYKFLSRGGSMTFTELLEYANLKSPFEEDSFIEVIEGVKTLLND